MKKFKLVTLLGIRPDIIRMHKLLSLLDKGEKKYEYIHIYAHTGQHFDYELDEIFYKQLNVRKPDINFHIGKTLKKSGRKTSHPYQTALLFEKTAQFLEEVRPDAVMYLGDTNSVLSSVIVAKYNIPVIHIEGGGRSFDWRMPEEKNRIIIDHLSDMIYCYLPRYREILLTEGIPPYRIKVVGNIIVDAVNSFLPLAIKSTILRRLKLKKRNYILVTIHREENISSKVILASKISDLVKLSSKLPIVFPIMPRMKETLREFKLLNILNKSKIIQTEPLGFLEFLKLEQDARLVITDSGTVQEESLILGTPCLVTRLSTERPETIEVGATIISNDNLFENALRAMQMETGWDRNVLNPYMTSPSTLIYSDLMDKLKTDFFKESRKLKIIGKEFFVLQAYGRNI